MTNKTLWFGLTGDQSIIENGVRTFALATGWQEKIVVDGEEVDNPVTDQDHASGKLYNFVSEVIQSYSANLGAEAGRKAALEQVSNAYVNVTHEISIESI